MQNEGADEGEGHPSKKETRSERKRSGAGAHPIRRYIAVEGVLARLKREAAACFSPGGTGWEKFYICEGEQRALVFVCHAVEDGVCACVWVLYGAKCYCGGEGAM